MTNPDCTLMTYEDADRHIRQARTALNRFLKDPDYLDNTPPHRLVGVAHAAIDINRAIESANFSRTIRES